MPPITAEEQLQRQKLVESVLGTHAMEGLFPDESTLAILRRYQSGELTLEQFSAEMLKDADAFVASRSLAGAA